MKKFTIALIVATLSGSAFAMDNDRASFQYVNDIDHALNTMVRGNQPEIGGSVDSSVMETVNSPLRRLKGDPGSKQ